MKKLLVILLCLGLAGCQTAKTMIMGTDYMNYNKSETGIEEAYKNGEISKAEYLDLKLKNRQVYQESGTQKVEIKK